VVDVAEGIEPVRVFVEPADFDRELIEREFDRALAHPPERSNGSWVVSQQKMLVKFLASEALVEKVEQVKALLSSRHPEASFAQVLEVLLDEYLDRHSPQARQRRREGSESRRSGFRVQVVNLRPSAPTVMIKTGQPRRDTSRPTCATRCSSATPADVPTWPPTARAASPATVSRSTTSAPGPREARTIPPT
jgi:hypothetical protein